MSYRKLGELVKSVDLKNTDGKITKVIGVSITKNFIPSVANLHGVDLTKYNLIKKNQFACKLMSVGRDLQLPIDLYKEDDYALISSAYYVFEVQDENVILPDYLNMWFRRSESDRWVGYISGGDVRGGISWDMFMEMDVKVPSIEKQREIVAQYEAVANKIKVNEAICEKLEATAQALYKHWFVDFEFPVSDTEALVSDTEALEVSNMASSASATRGYKSSGGAMVFNEELEKEIPEGWEVGTLGNICEFIDGDRGSNYPNGSDFIENGFCLFLNAGNVTKKGFDFSSCSFISKEKDNLLRKGKLKRQDIVITSRGTVGNIAFYTEFIEFENIRINSGMLILRPLIKPSFIYTLLKSYEFNKLIENYISGSAVPQLPIKDLSIIKILKSSDNIMNNFSSQVEYIYGLIDTMKNQNQKLTQLQSLLLSRLATLEG